MSRADPIRYLSLDWGGRWVGWATSDEHGTVVTAQGVFERHKDSREWQTHPTDIAWLEGLIKKEAISHLVLGLPLKMDGLDSPASLKARQLGASLEKRLGRPVALVDERYTSWEAEQEKGSHAESAALILRNFFAQKRQSS